MGKDKKTFSVAPPKDLQVVTVQYLLPAHTPEAAAWVMGVAVSNGSVGNYQHPIVNRLEGVRPARPGEVDCYVQMLAIARREQERDES